MKNRTKIIIVVAVLVVLAYYFTLAPMQLWQDDIETLLYADLSAEELIELDAMIINATNVSFCTPNALNISVTLEHCYECASDGEHIEKVPLKLYIDAPSEVDYGESFTIDAEIPFVDDWAFDIKFYDEDNILLNTFNGTTPSRTITNSTMLGILTVQATATYSTLSLSANDTMTITRATNTTAPPSSSPDLSPSETDLYGMMEEYWYVLAIIAGIGIFIFWKYRM